MHWQIKGKAAIKVRKRAKIRNQYNQTPHLTQRLNDDRCVSLSTFMLVFG